MFNDPITLSERTSGGIATHGEYQWAVVRSDGYGAERVRLDDTSFGLVINHSTSKNGDRHYVKVTRSVIAAHPLTGVNQQVNASISISFSKPAFGITDANMLQLYQILVDTIDDSEVTVANVLKFQS